MFPNGTTTLVNMFNDLFPELVKELKIANDLKALELKEQATTSEIDKILKTRDQKYCDKYF